MGLFGSTTEMPVLRPYTGISVALCTAVCHTTTLGQVWSSISIVSSQYVMHFYICFSDAYVRWICVYIKYVDDLDVCP